MVCTPFLLTYASSSCLGAFIATCVQSIAPRTLGKAAMLLNASLVLSSAWSLDGKVMYELESLHRASVTFSTERLIDHHHHHNLY